jgi:hypothetical protein
MQPDNRVQSNLGKQAEEFGRTSEESPGPTKQDIVVELAFLRLFRVEPYDNYINIYHITCDEDISRLRGDTNPYQLTMLCIEHLGVCNGMH